MQSMRMLCVVALMVVAVVDGDRQVRAGTADKVTGDTGNNAVTGNTGDNTNTGDTGKSVVTGDTGKSAVTGDTGKSVVTGKTGKSAITGDTGESADTGNTGDSADNDDPPESSDDNTSPDTPSPDATERQPRPRPHNTDPDTTDPDVTIPDNTDPDITDPDATADPDNTDPDATDPDATNPDNTDPDVTNPDNTDPDATDPDVTDPNNTDPDVTNPDATDPDATNPDPEVVFVDDANLEASLTVGTSEGNSATTSSSASAPTYVVPVVIFAVLLTIGCLFVVLVRARSSKRQKVVVNAMLEKPDTDVFARSGMIMNQTYDLATQDNSEYAINPHDYAATIYDNPLYEDATVIGDDYEKPAALTNNEGIYEDPSNHDNSQDNLVPVVAIDEQVYDIAGTTNTNVTPEVGPVYDVAASKVNVSAPKVSWRNGVKYVAAANVDTQAVYDVAASKVDDQVVYDVATSNVDEKGLYDIATPGDQSKGCVINNAYDVGASNLTRDGAVVNATYAGNLATTEATYDIGDAATDVVYDVASEDVNPLSVVYDTATSMNEPVDDNTSTRKSFWSKK